MSSWFRGFVVKRRWESAMTLLKAANHSIAFLIRSISSRTSRSAMPDTASATASRTTRSVSCSMTRRETRSTSSSVIAGAAAAGSGDGHAEDTAGSACSAARIAANASPIDGSSRGSVGTDRHHDQLFPNSDRRELRDRFARRLSGSLACTTAGSATARTGVGSSTDSGTATFSGTAATASTRARHRGRLEGVDFPHQFGAIGKLQAGWHGRRL